MYFLFSTIDPNRSTVLDFGIKTYLLTWMSHVWSDEDLLFPRLSPLIPGPCWPVWSPLWSAGSLWPSLSAHRLVVTRVTRPGWPRGTSTRASTPGQTPDWRSLPKPLVSQDKNSFRLWPTDEICCSEQFKRELKMSLRESGFVFEKNIYI